MHNKNRIFILDDEEQILASLKQVLEKDGFEVAALSKSKDALERLKAFGPDIIILDLRMPGLSGFEFCQILNEDKDTGSIPIIILSGVCDQADIKRAYKMGVESYITKPFEYEKLLKEIKKLLAFKEEKTS